MSGRKGKSKRSQGNPARAARPPATSQKARTVKRARPSGSLRPPRRPVKHIRSAALRSWLARHWAALVERALSPAPRVAQPLTELTREDLVWAAATGLVSAILFATTLKSFPGLADATEAVAGVSTLGILHAPGYPAYVLTAKLFTLLVPFGSEAFRVNLFSLVCAALTVAGVQLLARRCGAARWAGSVGALALAASAGFWFYADFAKHDIFSGLLFLIALHLALAWRARPTTGRLVGLAAVLGLGLGSSWPLMVLIFPAVAVVLFAARSKLSLRSLATATATGLVVLVVVYGFVMVRASENPRLNFDGASSISRLFELVRRSDFTASGTSVSSASSTHSGSSSKGAELPPSERPRPSGSEPAAAAITSAVGLSEKVKNYGVIFARELGILGLLVAAVGFLMTMRRRFTIASYPVLVAFLGNLVGAALTVGVGSNYGYGTDLIEEGFLLGCFYVLAVWIAIGAGELVTLAGSNRLAGRVDSHKRYLAAIAAVVLGAAIVVPLVSSGRAVAERSSKPYADRYAASIFADVPHGAVLIVGGADLSQPLIYDQVVLHRRRDVLVVEADTLSYPWYREQLQRLVGRPLPPRIGSSVPDAARIARWLAGIRPTYLDPFTSEELKGIVPYRTLGLLAQVESAGQRVATVTPAEVQQNVLAAERTAGFPDPDWDVWPNSFIADATYATAELRAARLYYQAHDLTDMRTALLDVLRIEPGQPAALTDLELLESEEK